jgi:hypothetical protein
MYLATLILVNCTSFCIAAFIEMMFILLYAFHKLGKCIVAYENWEINS